ncbi:MAG TPA: ABC transporter ATP-binding protein [Aggregatilinea sp.]|uniref:ABC transporter ATP-binding protein n=1 Tax=Aggregatilinea sp. TaxID=2806333 RepID=UPI002CE3E319|nr:ABC transporter ATP-binding protein [Aggregatilinea sp.]HML20844.1 ABC transporter ATP-binding protein [Aggregatilinea sp.]
MESQPAIHIEHLVKTFGGLRKRKRIQAVRDISFEVPAGTVYGFLGPNGAGKTTTIRMLLDLIHPTRGDAYIFGQHVHRNHGVLRRVGAIVEGAMFYNFLSARRNLEVLARTGDHYDAARIDSLLEQVGLTPRAGQRVKGYSTGMKQRLGLAAALLSDPDLLILDEPTNGLDPSGMHEIRSFIRDLADRQGKTVFLSSHLLGEIEQICDRVAIINRGQIVREGVVADLLAGKVQLHVEADPIAQAAALLNERWPVVSVNGGLDITAAREDMPHIVRRLVEGGVDVYQAVSQRQTLEDYFLAVTGDGPAHD